MWLTEDADITETERHLQKQLDWDHSQHVVRLALAHHLADLKDSRSQGHMRLVELQKYPNLQLIDVENAPPPEPWEASRDRYVKGWKLIDPSKPTPDQPALWVWGKETLLPNPERETFPLTFCRLSDQWFDEIQGATWVSLENGKPAWKGFATQKEAQDQAAM